MTSTEEKDIPEVGLGEFVKHIGLRNRFLGVTACSSTGSPTIRI
ncbi:hypothetical protein SAMN03159488_01809 [Pseudomonas sp. NFIX10]|nr:hypothetical protein SAMN03159488_01809 [Pseudomonas sp. NFIX10]SFE86027.1 hypothetical protein SAMN03159367_02298 [Pseudomonas sp. NFACC06-1]